MTYTWLKRIRGQATRCPSCTRMDWMCGDLEPVALLMRPNSPSHHPELKYGADAKAVLPVTCKYCGYVATYSVEHLEGLSPWE